MNLDLLFLSTNGFKYITTTPVKDVRVGEEEKLDKITSVKIGFVDSFKSSSKLPANFPVTIYYHAYYTIPTPVSSRSAKGESYEEIETKFKEAGFTNIEIKVDYDVVVGWFADVGEVESVTINGENFDSGEEYRPEEVVVITYHDLKKNKKK